jgi:hypothetical protein
VLWSYRHDFPGIRYRWQLELPGYSAVKDLADRNVAAAILSLARGDKASALLRAREDIAGGLQFLRDPLLHYQGLLIVEDGREALAQIGRVTSDPGLIQEAGRLRAGLRTAREQERRIRDLLPVLMADPVAPVGLRVVSDTTLSPYLRWRLIEAIVWGHCLNTREVLFGIDQSRRDALVQAASLAKDIPRTNEWVALNQRTMDQWIASPSEMFSALNFVNPPITQPLGWFGMRGARDRFSACIWVHYLL